MSARRKFFTTFKKHAAWLVVIAGLALFLAFFGGRLLQALAPVFWGIIIAYALFPLVRSVERRIPSLWAAALVYLSVIAALAAAAVLLLPGLIREAQAFIESLPRILSTIDDTVRGVIYKLLGLSEPVPADPSQWNIEGRLDIPRLVNNMIAGLGIALLAPVFAIMFTRDRVNIAHRILYLIPQKKREWFCNTCTEIDSLLRGFLRGQLLIALCAAMLGVLAFFAIGVNYAAVLGIIFGVFNFIPFFGPIIGAVPVLAVAVMQDIPTLIWTALSVFAIAQVGGLVLSPILLGDRLRLHAASILALILVGAGLGGIPGVLLVIPAALIIRTLVVNIYRHSMYKPGKWVRKSD